VVLLPLRLECLMFNSNKFLLIIGVSEIISVVVSMTYKILNGMLLVFFLSGFE